MLGVILFLLYYVGTPSAVQHPGVILSEEEIAMVGVSKGRRLATKTQRHRGSISPVFGSVKPLGLAVVLLVFVVLAVACSEVVPSTQSIETVTPRTLSQTPLELYKSSFERTSGVRSFRSRVDIETKMLGQNLPVSMDIEMGQDGRMRMITAMDMPDGNLDFEMVIDGSYVYLKMPDIMNILSIGWVRMGIEEVEELTGQSLGLDINDYFGARLFPDDDVPWELHTVESLGREELDGVPTERLSVQVDFPKYIEQLDDEDLGQLLEAVELSGALSDLAGLQELMDQMALLGMEVWIDDEGYTRRTLMEVEMALLGGEISTSIDMRMFDFDEEIQIELPEDYQELPAFPGFPGF